MSDSDGRDTLRTLQLRLGRAFFEDGTGGPGAAAALSGLRALPRVSATRCLGIYESAVENALRGALSEIFPVCEALVGEEYFRALARDYGRAAPSEHPDLGSCGATFPGFLEQQPSLDGLPYLPDVARLELAWHAAFAAPDPPSTTDPEALAEALSQRPEQWRFRLPPSARLVSSPHPVLAIWEAHQEDSDAAGDFDIDFGSGPDRIIVWRQELDMRVQRVEAGLWPLLEAIALGCSVAQLLTLGEPGGASAGEELGELPATDFAPVLESVGELLSRGWIAGAEPVGETPGAD
jgi:hypothetical protein